MDPPTALGTVYGSRHTRVNPSPAITVAIIAGGVGRRLGHIAKGLIPFGNSTLIERLITEAPPGALFINANLAEPYAFLDVPIIADLEPGHGAPGGVVTALAMANTEAVLVLACDMPRVTRRAMDELVEAFDDEVDVVCYERRGELEPLCALYRRSLVHRWLPQLQQNPSLRRLILDSRVRLLQVDDDSLLDSVNQPDDLTRLTHVGR